MNNELNEAKDAVLRRMESYETQGCLPADLNSLLSHLALFDGLGALGGAAARELCNDGVLVYDRTADQIDIRRRLERMLEAEW